MHHQNHLQGRIRGRPQPMDMRDFLPGDVYHRFPQIEAAEIQIWFISNSTWCFVWRMRVLYIARSFLMDAQTDRHILESHIKEGVNWRSECASIFDTQDYLKDLARRHPEVVEVEQVQDKKQHKILCPLPNFFILLPTSYHHHPHTTTIMLILNMNNLTKLGSSHEGRAIWMVKIGRGAAGELTPRWQIKAASKSSFSHNPHHPTPPPAC